MKKFTLFLVFKRAGPISNLSELNNLLDLASTCEKRSNDCIVFHGIHSVFSNFHPAPFRLGEKCFPSAEHAIQYQKADLFDDDFTKDKILHSDSPYQAKKFGSRVRNFDRNKWEDNLEQIGYNAIFAKFSQNELLKRLLKATGELTIAEASREQPWGTGVPLRNKQAATKENWSREGVMSKILQR